MEYRDRAAGWKHAKLSGHKNEALVKIRLDTDADFAESFLKRIGRASARIVSTSIGGLHETDVPGVNGRKTKSKTDLKVTLDTGETVNVSIKKSLAGQVYFVGARLFIETFEKQFKTQIPKEVCRAIALFWAAAEDAGAIIGSYGDRSCAKSFALQQKHKSLNATTLRAYDRQLCDALLQWFSDHAYEIAKLSFSMGAACSPGDWSEYVWYINLLEENDTDAIFPIEDLCFAAQRAAKRETCYGTAYGGTTIQLPFGFVQWHQAKMQFHHQYEKVKALAGQKA